VPIHAVADLKKIAAATASASPSLPCWRRRRRWWSTRWSPPAQGGPQFLPGTLDVPPGVKMKSVDLTVSLENLSFFLARAEHED
jgi:hypothetical protein